MNSTNEPTSFFIAFQVAKKHIFTVDYYRLGSNTDKNFHTQAAILNHCRTDYNQCGQAQESVLNKNMSAYRFYKKWDDLHCSIMTSEQYDEMLIDLDELKRKYDFLESEMEINFSDIVKLDRTGKFNKR